MARSQSSRDISRLLTIVIAAAAIAVLYLAKVVILPLALAILFAFLVSPAVQWLERRRVPRIPAIIVVIVAVFAIVAVITWGVASQLLQITERLPLYRSNIAAKVAEIHKTQSSSVSRTEKELERLGREVGLTGPSSNRGAEPLGSSPDKPVLVKGVSSPESGTLASLHGVLRVLLETLLVVVFTFFILLQREDLRNRLLRLTGKGELHLKTQAMNEASDRIARYFSLLLAVNATYGLTIFIALYFLRLPHAWLFGTLTVLLRFIPYIGAPISALLPIALSLAVFPGWAQTLIIMGIFLCVEVVTANYIEPRLYGKHTGVSPLAILVAAVFWTLIWGPIGLILSVPLTVCMVILGEHVPSLRFLRFLLGDQPVLQPYAQYYQRLLAGDQHEAAMVLEAYLKDKPLEDLYDSVLIPALEMSEQDRHRNNLDDDTVTFIYQTTRELVDELGVHAKLSDGEPAALPESKANSEPIPEGAAPDAARPQVIPRTLLCIPVRDEADDIAAVMLTQLLERAGHTAQAISEKGGDALVTEIARAKPEIIILSAIPPFALSAARAAYRKLRGLEPRPEILIGLWNYVGDPVEAAREIGAAEQKQVWTTLSQAVTQASAPPAQQVDNNVPALLEK